MSDNDPILQQVVAGIVTGLVTTIFGFFFGKKKGYTAGVQDASLRPPPDGVVSVRTVKAIDQEELELERQVKDALKRESPLPWSDTRAMSAIVQTLRTTGYDFTADCVAKRLNRRGGRGSTGDA